MNNKEVFLHLLFFLCILLQTILWPNALTVSFIVILMAAWAFMVACAKDGAYNLIFNSGVFIRRENNGKVIPNSYVFASFMLVYSLSFFILYATQQLRDMPYMTGWIHPKFRHNYSFTESRNNLMGDINNVGNVYMRENTFTWPRLLKAPGIRINGTLPRAGPGGGPLVCGTKADCYAANMMSPDESPLSPDNPPMVPMSSQFYTTDIMITPPSGVKCSDLEVYRIVYNSWMAVDYNLDYPAASLPRAVSGSSKCSLFGDAAWCLTFMHTFSDADYKSTVAKKCEVEGGSLIFRLPPRIMDVEPETGRMALDAMLVTMGANVSFRYTWHNRVDDMLLLDSWVQWEDTKSDEVQYWRESTDISLVMLRYVIVITPFILLWYFLLVNYNDSSEYILPLCIFVLLPSSLLFFVVGAWLPLAGAVLCGIAAQLPVGITSHIVFLVLTFLCNLVHCIASIVVFSKFGTNAFMHADSMRMLQQEFDVGAFVTGSPAWITLTMPSVVALNVCFCVGTAYCIFLEYRMRK